VEANKKFSYTGQETLNCAQSLYEKKMTSYPRTDSQYINQENFENLKTFIPKLAEQILNLKYSIETEKPKSVNDKKLTGSHDAIVPTGQTNSHESLNEKEKNVYHLILHKCLESFSTPAEYKKLKLVFDNNENVFTTNTSKLLKQGWKSFSFSAVKEDENQAEDEQNLDLPYKKNDKVKVENLEIKEIESKPPALYTEASLTPDLTNIGKFLKEENPELYEELSKKIDLKDIQIGTQATRPSIIERLKFLKFIEVNKNKFLPTEKGLSYYETLKNLQVSDISNTAILEKKLKDIADGSISEEDFYSDINDYTRKIIDDIFSLKDSQIQINSEKKSTEVGKCPKCKKGQIREGNKSYYCTEYKSGCDFVIGKTILGKKITEVNIKELITNRETKTLKGFDGKKGKFDAKLKINDDFKLEFEFVKKMK
jgi:DNA topoisomerase-3